MLTFQANPMHLKEALGENCPSNAKESVGEKTRIQLPSLHLQSV